MAPSLCNIHASAVVDREEDMCGFRKVGECGFQTERILSVLQHEGHAGSEKDDVCFGVAGELFPLEVFLPEADGVVGKPVILADRVDVFAGEPYVVVAQVWVVGGKLGQGKC